MGNMETVNIKLEISADKRKVWNKMLEKESYKLWTNAFHEGSYYEGSWDKGSAIRFLIVDKSGKLQGTFARVKENIEYEFAKNRLVLVDGSGQKNSAGQVVCDGEPTAQ